MNTADHARSLILQYGYNATAYQILNPGIRHWFAASAPAVVGYVPIRNTWVVAGAPVCAAPALSAVTAELESAASAQNRRVCYIAAAARLKSHFHNSTRHACVTLGAQPVWNPADWPAVLRSKRSLRAQLSRARNKGVTIHAVDPRTAAPSPSLRACLDQWLAARPMPPMHFLVEPATFDGELADRLLLVASQNDTPVAFLMASPVPTRHGYLVEQIIRTPHAPNGTAELLIDALMATLATRHCPYLTMGLVPLSTFADPWLRQNPLWLRSLTAWARAHGRRFYHFDGLENFRAKLLPSSWEPLFAIANEPRFSPRSFLAMSSAFANTSLPRFLLTTLAKAVASEARTLGRRLLPSA